MSRDKMQSGQTKEERSLSRSVLVNNWFARKRRLFLLTTTASFPLPFYERLIYSFLVGRLAVGVDATEKEIVQSTHLDRFRTVKRGLAALVEAGLISQSGEIITASEPVGETADWFAIRNETAKNWWDRLAYVPLYLQSAASPLSPRTNALLFLLYSLGNGRNVAEGQTSPSVCDAL